jgi:hypothetical protein
MSVAIGCIMHPKKESLLVKRPNKGTFIEIGSTGPSAKGLMSPQI